MEFDKIIGGKLFQESLNPMRSPPNEHAISWPLLAKSTMIFEYLTYHLCHNLGLHALAKNHEFRVRVLWLLLYLLSYPIFYLSVRDATGDKFAAALIEIRPEIPVILCTGYSKQLSAERAAEVGIKAYAMKPLARNIFAETVRKVLDEAKG